MCVTSSQPTLGVSDLKRQPAVGLRDLKNQPALGVRDFKGQPALGVRDFKVNQRWICTTSIPPVLDRCDFKDQQPRPYA